jgi:phosphate/sulfate permease
MLLSFIKYSYRLLSTLVVLLPIVLNVIYPSSIVSSLIYVPLLSLTLAVFFVYLEKQLLLSCLIINKRIQTSKKILNQKLKSDNQPLEKICESIKPKK